MPSIEIEIASSTRDLLGESTFWDHQSKSLWWVDIRAGLIRKRDGKSGNIISKDFGTPVGCIAPMDDNKLIVAAKNGFWTFGFESEEKQFLGDPESHLPDNRFNDGATDPAGRLWAGTMREGDQSAPGGTFYCLDHDRKITPWRDGFFTTNGCAFSPQGDIIYFSDSFASVRKIWKAPYDLASATPGTPELFFDTQGLAGRPDGATVDAQGYYWFAGVSGGQIYRISPSGALDMTIDVPVEKPTRPVFGGKNLDILYVTSISENVEPSEKYPQNTAGALLAIHNIGVQGFAQARFKG